MRPVLLCINRDRGTVTRYVPANPVQAYTYGKRMIADTVHEIANPARFAAEFTVADCEEVRRGQ